MQHVGHSPCIDCEGQSEGHRVNTLCIHDIHIVPHCCMVVDPWCYPRRLPRREAGAWTRGCMGLVLQRSLPVRLTIARKMQTHWFLLVA